MKRYLPMVAIAFFLTGCVTTKQLPSTPPAPQVKLEEIKQWTLRGKLGIQYKEKGANANLDWRQENNNYVVKLSGPLGQGGLQIIGDESKVTLIDQKGKRVEVASLDAFFKKQFGWELPVQCLTYWIKGVPASGDQVQATYFENGKLKTLTQHDWHIEYQEYMTTPHGLLPQRLILRRPGTQLKIVIKQWEF
jgi:outer membrane lipoprotein LolB